MTLSPDPTLEVPRTVRDEMVAHALGGRPREVCGVLAGEFGGRTSRVTDRHPAENVATPPETRYEIDPEQQYAILDRIDEAGEEVVGFYHSHPSGPPGPSRTDAAQAAWPERSYVIVILDGLEDGNEGSGPGGDGDPDGRDAVVGSWRWTGEEFRKEDVVIVD